VIDSAIVERLRALLTAAAPRPWRQSTVARDAILSAQKVEAHLEHYYGGAPVAESAKAEDIALIVAAINALPELLDQAALFEVAYERGYVAAVRAHDAAKEDGYCRDCRCQQ
jgi:hypothetical protein